MDAPAGAVGGEVSEQRSQGLVRYPVRLEGDIFAYLHLPTVLTMRDVARITAIMERLVVEQVKAEVAKVEYEQQ